MAEPVTISLLRRGAVIDMPGCRSSHTVPTPRGGGVPIAVGLVAAALLVGHQAGIAFGSTVAGFGLIGLTEDVIGLPAATRFALQSAGAALVAAVLLSALRVPAVALAGLVAMAAVWIIGFVNAFNFMDGVNGISAAHALIGGTVYALLGWWRPDDFLAPTGAAMAVGALAFLPWNAGRAKVFLGDAGSYALGAALAVLSCYSVIKGVPPEAALGPLALYLADTGWTLQRRIRAGERWLEPHRTHTYQRWCDMGWSHQRVTLTAAAITTLLSLLGAVSLAGRPVLRVLADLADLAVLAAYLSSPSLLSRQAARNAAPARGEAVADSEADVRAGAATGAGSAT